MSDTIHIVSSDKVKIVRIVQQEDENWFRIQVFIDRDNGKGVVKSLTLNRDEIDKIYNFLHVPANLVSSFL